MARLKETIYKRYTDNARGQDSRGEVEGGFENHAYAEKNLQPMVDVGHRKSGQNGSYTNFEGYVSNAAYVRRNLIAVLIEAPRGFEDLPDPDKWKETLKGLVELQANSIEGLTSTLNVEFVENAVGGAGEIQEDFSNVTRERSTPSFTWTEKYGKPINAFLEGWITNLMMDPITKVPNVTVRHFANENAPHDLLPDYTGATMLFFEPDPTHTRVIHAWLCTNMHPKTAGEVVSSRDLTTAGESVDYTVEFTSLTQEGYGVKLFAQEILNKMNDSSINPNLMPAFVEDYAGNERLEDTISRSDAGIGGQLGDVNNNDGNIAARRETNQLLVDGVDNPHTPDKVKSSTTTN